MNTRAITQNKKVVTFGEVMAKADRPQFPALFPNKRVYCYLWRK